MADIDEYLFSEKVRFQRELCDWLRTPSISADPSRTGDMQRSAHWLEDRLACFGFTTELISTGGPPLLYAEGPHLDSAPTALVYGHYDVQPADPLDLWISPPFEPTVREGNVYARGASDDKGQVLTHVYAAEAWLATKGRLPVNLKFLIEGGEEVGSSGLEEFLAAHAERLACDCVIISDGSQFAPGLPAITYGLRGIAYYEIRLHGPDRDLHSGSYGGSVTNPANALMKLLAALVDEHGRIQVPGFYDDVVPLTPRERGLFAALPFDERQYFSQIGVSSAVGEEGYTALERCWARPSLDINGAWSGYQGPGRKTVLPAEAGAKLSFRLVPDQVPQKIGAAFRAMLQSLCPTGIRMELIEQATGPAVVIPLDSPYVKAAARAIEYAFGRAPVFKRDGASIPIVAAFNQALRCPTLLLGWGQDDDNAHAPNEKFSLADFHRGIRASARLWKELSEIHRS